MNIAEEMREIADKAREPILKEQEALARREFAEFVAEIEKAAYKGEYCFVKTVSVCPPGSRKEMLDFLAKLLEENGFGVCYRDIGRDTKHGKEIGRVFTVTWEDQK